MNGMNDADLYQLKLELDRIDKNLRSLKIKYYLRHPIKAFIALIRFINPFKKMG